MGLGEFILRAVKRVVIRPLPVLLAGCAGQQSVLNPAGEQAREITYLWWGFLAVLSCVYLIVLSVTLIAVWRRRRSLDEWKLLSEPEVRGERRMAITVSSAVGLTIVILFVLMISDFFTGRATHAMPLENVLNIKITGHQWWWEVAYQDPVPSQMVTTANEIHVPVGRPVQFELSSADVIHSFWAPNFNGKKDLVPGHPTTVWFRAERAGTFRGQCAEFCGFQHAHMRFVIVAQPTNEFDSWLDAQRKPPPAPATDSQKRGHQVFMNSACVLCHTIQGTPARGMIGPDLSHVGGREMIGAGTLPNSRGHLSGWIIDPQQIKPGVRMPQNELSAEELKAVLDYLESLK
jgi:cytochrome c oxidase subunit 2